MGGVQEALFIDPNFNPPSHGRPPPGFVQPHISRTTYPINYIFYTHNTCFIFVSMMVISMMRLILEKSQAWANEVRLNCFFLAFKHERKLGFNGNSKFWILQYTAIILQFINKQELRIIHRGRLQMMDLISANPI